MITIITLVYCVLVMIFFGAIKLLDSKKEEFVQFLVMYLFFLLFMLCLTYISELVRTEGYLPFRFVRDHIRALMFYAPPTFLIAYLLYPFKTIKRNRTLIWILLGYTLIVVGGGTLLSILVAYSNM